MKRLKQLLLLAFNLLFLGLLSAQNQQQVLSPEMRIFHSQWKTASQNEQKGHNAFYELEQKYGLRKLNNAAKSETYYLPVYISFSDVKALAKAEEMGVVLETILENICTALVLPESLEALSKIPGIVYIEPGRKVGLTLDKSREKTKVNAIHAGTQLPQFYKGEGVVIGVVDAGFDYTHPAFYDPDTRSLYRVKKVWDQNATGTAPDGFSYGAEYATKDDILAAQYSVSGGSHATHVAGIAAGSANRTSYSGIAPKSDLVFVGFRSNDQDIINGLSYIRSYALSENKPCVVNLSLSYLTGPHDGTSAFDRACDQMKANGFIIVGAAGNEGEKPYHLAKTFSVEDTVLKTVIEFQDVFYKGTILDIWNNENENFAVNFYVINAATGAVIAEMDSWVDMSVSELADTIFLPDNKRCLLNFSSEINPHNNKPHMYVVVDMRSDNGNDSQEIVMVIKDKKNSTPSHLNMWMSAANFSRGASENPEMTPGDLISSVCEVGGTGKNIISVGSYNSKNTWRAINGNTTDESAQYPENDLSRFSSRGPTADNRVKPDITAPGAYIASALNSYSMPASTTIVETISTADKSYGFGVMRGTSMAAPAVTGIIALWLEADSTLNVDDIKEILAETAINDTYTGDRKDDPDNNWGIGKIDAYEGILEVLRRQGHSGIKVIEEANNNNLVIYPNPSYGSFTLETQDQLQPNDRIEISDIYGRLVKTMPLEKQSTEVSGLAAGFYLVSVKSGNQIKETKKVVVF